MLAVIRTLNRLESVGETLRAALNSLAVVALDWLLTQVTSDWFDRYGTRVEEYRLPKGQEAREVYAAQIGADGFQLLDAIDADDTRRWLQEVPAVQTLRRMWVQQYTRQEGQVRLRIARQVLERASASIRPMTWKPIMATSARPRGLAIRSI